MKEQTQSLKKNDLFWVILSTSLL